MDCLNNLAQTTWQDKTPHNTTFVMAFFPFLLHHTILFHQSFLLFAQCSAFSRDLFRMNWSPSWESFGCVCCLLTLPTFSLSSPHSPSLPNLLTVCLLTLLQLNSHHSTISAQLSKFIYLFIHSLTYSLTARMLRFLLNLLFLPLLLYLLQIFQFQLYKFWESITS